MDSGEAEQVIMKQLQPWEPVPDVIANKPILRPYLLFYLTAFYDLDADRGIGMSQGRIGWTAIKLYADHYGCDEIEFDELLTYVWILDAVYLKWIKEQSDK